MEKTNIVNVYERCPRIENDRYLLRFVEKNDDADLLKVYSDKNALPFFNSDNCDGDNFYYPTKEKMQNAIEFWIKSYETRWFVRWVIVDKTTSGVIGSVEMFYRTADDDFNDVGLLRLDVRSDYEKYEVILEILRLFVPDAYKLFDCNEIITKVPIYAVERMEAVQRYGFSKSEFLLIGTNDHYAYNGYWIIKNK